MRRALSRTRRVLIIGALSATAWSAQVAAQCLAYGDATLAGTLVRQTYPGAPDFKSLSKDKPVVIWVLQLGYRVCVTGGGLDAPNEYRETEVQVVLEPEQYERYQNLLGKHVIVSGKLLHGGASYDKRLILVPAEITVREGP